MHIFRLTFGRCCLGRRGFTCNDNIIHYWWVPSSEKGPSWRRVITSELRVVWRHRDRGAAQKNLVAYPSTFQSSITRNSLIPRRIEVKLVSMESERSILHVYNQFFLLLCTWINFKNRQICLAAYFCAKRKILNWWRYQHIFQRVLHFNQNNPLYFYFTIIK